MEKPATPGLPAHPSPDGPPPATAGPPSEPPPAGQPPQAGSSSRTTVLEAVVLLGLLAAALVVAGLVGGAQARQRTRSSPVVRSPATPPPVTRPTRPKPSLRAPPARPPVERGGALAFAREVESALESGDTEFLDARFDIRGWLARGDPDRIEGAIAAFEELRGQGRGLGSIIVGSLDQLGASAQFLRIREREGKTTALFRLLGDETFAHLELLLVPDDAGRPAIEDVVFLAHGTRFSDAIVDPRDNGSVGRLRSLVGTGHPKEVLLGLAALPPSLQERGDVLLLRLEVARELSGVEYDDAAARIEAAAARRTGLEHLTYIVHHEREQHARCAADLDALDRAVGGDPYLDVLRAQHRLIADDLAGAASFAQAARTADPSLYEAHSTLLAVALRQGDHARALELMTHLEEEFGDPFEDVAEAADFEGFRGSPQHAAWLDRHAAEPPGPGAGEGERR